MAFSRFFNGGGGGDGKFDCKLNHALWRTHPAPSTMTKSGQFNEKKSTLVGKVESTLRDVTLTVNKQYYIKL